MAILKATNIFKSFNNNGNITNVLNGINIEIEEGKFISIMGQSGSGKSTLLYVLSGLDRPEKGSVVFNGEEITGLNDSRLSKIRRKDFGFIFQFYNLIPSLNVIENITLPAELGGMVKKDYTDSLNEILGKVGLEDKTKNFPYQLSGGQQQRVAIARALITEPKIIFADEPTGNLDSNTGEEILKLLYNLSRKYKKTIIMVTHDKNASLSSDTVINIKDGRII